MTFEEFRKTIQERFPEMSPEQFGQFRMMEEIYRDWNSKINVISRKDIDQLYRHHVMHSMCIAAFIKTQHPDIYGTLRDTGADILDLGTGGGFPGIPLAIMFPQAHFTLCDSIGKKITVAAGAATALGLKNVTTVNARAESLDGNFDYVVSRAVTSLDNFMPWVKGKYSHGIFYLKGGDMTAEIAAMTARCGIRKESVHIWPIKEWICDPYFDEKSVIFIE